MKLYEMHLRTGLELKMNVFRSSLLGALVASIVSQIMMPHQAVSD